MVALYCSVRRLSGAVLTTGSSICATVSKGPIIILLKVSNDLTIFNLEPMSAIFAYITKRRFTATQYNIGSQDNPLPPRRGLQNRVL